MSLYLFVAQVQDFYIYLKLNDGPKCIKALYKLFIASCMLRAVEVPGKSQAHNYPKMQLSYMLLLSYWKSVGHCTYEMFKHCTGIFNEELGEITFSILSRVSIGDHTKDNFEHMNKMYNLIPVFRDLKSEVLRDNNVSTSLSWRHKIDTAGEEVQSAVLFFKKCIRQIENGRFMSYSRRVATYTSAANAALHLTREVVPLVWLEKEPLRCYVQKLYKTIRSDLQGNFMYGHHDLWPEANIGMLNHPNDSPYESSDEDSKSGKDNVDGKDSDLDSGVPAQSGDESPDPKSPYSSDHFSESNNEQNNPANSALLDSPYYNRTWRAWGTVHAENQMIGRRRREAPDRLVPSRRRLVGGGFLEFKG